MTVPATIHKVIPYAITGAVTLLIVVWLANVLFPQKTTRQIKQLEKEVAALRKDANALRDTVTARDTRIAAVTSQIEEINNELIRVKTNNVRLQAILRGSYRIHETSDAELIAALNRAHRDTSVFLKASGAMPR